MKVLPNRAPFSLNFRYISWYISLISGTCFWYVTHFSTHTITCTEQKWVRVPEMIRVLEKMVSVPEKWAVYHIMYQYFQYSTKYVPEKSVRVPTDLSAYNSAYHHYHLMYRKEREILVQNNWFLLLEYTYRKYWYILVRVPISKKGARFECSDRIG